MRDFLYRMSRFGGWLAGFLLVVVMATPAIAQTASISDELYERRDCVISPHEVVDVSSAVPGLLASVAVERSEEVQAGQILAELEANVERASLDLAQAWASLESEILIEDATNALERRRQGRIGRLYASRAVALEDKDQAETEAVLAGLRVRQAREKRWIREFDEKKAAAVLERRMVRSPITGFVAERFRTAGEYVENQPILRLARLDPLRIETIVPMHLFGQIRTGMRAEIQPEHDPDTAQQATVSIVDRMGDTASGTFGVRLTMANPDGQTPAGMKCTMRFLPGTHTASNEDPAPLSPKESAAAGDTQPDSRVAASRQQPQTEAKHSPVTKSGLTQTPKRSNTPQATTAQIKRAEAKPAELKRAELKRAELKQAELKQAELKQAELKRAELKQAELKQAELKRAELKEAELKQAELKRAELKRAELKQAELKQAELKQAELKRAELKLAELKRAELKQAELKRAELKRAELKQAELKRAELKLAELKQAELKQAELKRAELKQAELKQAELKRAELKHAELKRAELKRAELKQAEFKLSEVKQAAINRAKAKLAEIKQAQHEQSKTNQAALKPVQAEIEQANTKGTETALAAASDKPAPSTKAHETDSLSASAFALAEPANSPDPFASDQMSSSQCASFGPLPSRESASAIAARLRAAGALTETVPISERSVFGYLLVTPLQPDQRAARVLSRRLAAAGLRGLQVMGYGEFRDRVAIAAYDNEGPGRRYKDALHARGIEAELLPRTRTASHWQVRAQLPDTTEPNGPAVTLPSSVKRLAGPCNEPREALTKTQGNAVALREGAR